MFAVYFRIGLINVNGTVGPVLSFLEFPYSRRLCRLSLDDGNIGFRFIPLLAFLSGVVIGVAPGSSRGDQVRRSQRQGATHRLIQYITVFHDLISSSDALFCRAGYHSAYIMLISILLYLLLVSLPSAGFCSGEIDRKHSAGIMPVSIQPRQRSHIRRIMTGNRLQ